MNVDFTKRATLQLIKSNVELHCKALKGLISLFCSITDSDLLFDSHLNNCISIIERSFKL